MNKILATVSFSILCSFSATLSVFDFTITTNDGREQSLSVYRGKNIMIVILPSTQNDTTSAILNSLDSLHRELKDSLTIIGIPSYEDGYADDSLESIMSWYHSVLDTDFVVAQAMNTSKSSPYQSELFHWLTHAEENGHFDQDAMGAGEKFIMTTDGALHGLISPDTPFDADILKQILDSME